MFDVSRAMSVSPIFFQSVVSHVRVLVPLRVHMVIVLPQILGATTNYSKCREWKSSPETIA